MVSVIRVGGSPIRVKKKKICGFKNTRTRVEGSLDLKAYRLQRVERALNSIISIIISCFLRLEEDDRRNWRETDVFRFSIFYFSFPNFPSPTPLRLRSINPLSSSSFPGSSRVGEGPGNEVESRGCDNVVDNVTSTQERFCVQRV